jgi:hypothetical protein
MQMTLDKLVRLQTAHQQARTAEEYDELLTALKRAVYWLNAADEMGMCGEESRKDLDAMRAAIARAEEA